MLLLGVGPPPSVCAKAGCVGGIGGAGALRYTFTGKGSRRTSALRANGTDPVPKWRPNTGNLYYFSAIVKLSVTSSTKKIFSQLPPRGRSAFRVWGKGGEGGGGVLAPLSHPRHLLLSDSPPLTTPYSHMLLIQCLCGTKYLAALK